MLNNKIYKVEFVITGVIFLCVITQNHDEHHKMHLNSILNHNACTYCNSNLCPYNTRKNTEIFCKHFLYKVF